MNRVLVNRRKELLRAFTETLMKSPEGFLDWYIAHEAAIFCCVLDDILGSKSRVIHE